MGMEPAYSVPSYPVVPATHLCDNRRIRPVQAGKAREQKARWTPARRQQDKGWAARAKGRVADFFFHGHKFDRFDAANLNVTREAMANADAKRPKMEPPVDVFDRSPVVPVTRGVKHRFANPYGRGDVCAAGVLPLLKDTATGEVRVLLGEEDMHYDQEWTPALAILGGKVDSTDRHWMTTVARELKEETGGLLSSEALERVSSFDPKSALYSTYLPPAKYQVVVYPVDAQDRDEWESLPERYALAFGGKLPEDCRSRSATKLHWVALQASGGAAVSRSAASASTSSWTLNPVVHECAGDGPLACALRRGKPPPALVLEACPCLARGKALPLKQELKFALCELARLCEPDRLV